MKIDSMKYVLRDNGHYWLKINGYWVMKSTYLHAYAAILANWGAIDWSVKQTAKSMMADAWGDPAVWGLNQALGRSAKFFVTHDMLPLPLEVARKRNGQPYKRGSTKYVLAGTQLVAVAHAIVTRPVKRVGSIDPRTIRIDPAMQSAPV